MLNKSHRHHLSLKRRHDEWGNFKHGSLEDGVGLVVMNGWGESATCPSVLSPTLFITREVLCHYSLSCVKTGKVT